MEMSALVSQPEMGKDISFSFSFGFMVFSYLK